MSENTATEEKRAPGGKGRRPRRRPPRNEPRIFTKYSPRRAGEGQALSCTTDTSLKPDQLLELYRI